ncbi:DUF6442 family protein [Clostridium tepidum]|jgi:hypothetical protein|uniref:DUF4181 domain-containing protein n=1 Tax=Clostridium tepidum TaxID=1962263 RepID=A0A1S9IHY2_9CLOT|nr:DUF6442 family protein [Clostridium tepidum]MCR1934998.1 DUF6442 family protein [Clostridium tepidum]MDU6877538.1 DUF6442 family protein [Clostridium botulinum]OOO62091.1 hypothetical protein BS637_08140 [Clostridium tepidum]OOO69941.1 hypothetical protein BS638_00730 [Clostridium tepidum]
MNKEEILKNSKRIGLDEREQSVYLSSFGYGNIITVILCFLFIVINGIKGESYFEFITITGALMASTNYYKHRKLEDTKSFLIISIISGFTAIISFIIFIIK